MKKLLIVGAGFGGIYTYLNLRKLIKSKQVEVTIIDKNNYFLFTPLLHEVATGSLDAQHVITPVRSIVKKVYATFIEDFVEDIDIDKKVVTTANNSYKYDYLVIATGSNSMTPNVPGAKQYTCKLKTIQNALDIKNRILENFELASHTKSKQERDWLLTFAIIGGGPTGVELAAEISEFTSETLIKLYPGISHEDISINLIHNQDELISSFNNRSSRKALKVLKDKGVKVHLNSFVKKVTGDLIELVDGKHLKSSFIVWTGGIAPNIGMLNLMKLGDDEHIITRKDLRLLEHPEVYVIGDIAAGYPSDAQAAISQAKYVAKHLSGEITNKPINHNYKYHEKGKMLSLGRKTAIAQILGLTFSGRIVWFIWRTTYLVKMVSTRKKIQVAINWTFNLFSPRDISKI